MLCVIGGNAEQAAPYIQGKPNWYWRTRSVYFHVAAYYGKVKGEA
jgi:hypothetical protein